MGLSLFSKLSFLDKHVSSWLLDNNINTHSSILSDLFQKNLAYVVGIVKEPKSYFLVSHFSQASLSLVLC